jgi:hypothetical protein
VDLKSREGIDLLQLCFQLVWPITKFARFARKIDLQKYRHRLRSLFGAFADFLRDVKAVHALNHFEQFHGIAAFIGLQMSNEMPAQLAGARGNFCFGLLDFVLTEQRETEPPRFTHNLGRLPFGYSEEHDGGRVAVRPLARGANALLN